MGLRGGVFGLVVGQTTDLAIVGDVSERQQCARARIGHEAAAVLEPAVQRI